MAAGTAGGGPLFSPPVQSQGVLSVPEAFFFPGSDGFVEKKRRLSADQMQFLEKSFELENKLEPERKVQLGKDLGLQPWQIAIWFQNRRARWKTKGLEKGYEALQGSYNALKAEYDVLIKERDVLKDQVHDLTYELQLNPGFSSKILEGIVQNPTVESASNEVTNIPNILPSKHDEICVAKSDTPDSDSPHYADCSPSQLLEPGDASCSFNWDQSDISQDEEENLSMTLLPTHMMFSKLENHDLADPLALKSSPFGFSADGHSVWSWPY